jgi:trimeric autotransporter adhesin
MFFFAAYALGKAENLQSSKELKAMQKKAKIIYTGFIAREVEQAAKKLNYDFSGVDKPKTEKGFYALLYGDFIVPLVKAVQEQQKQIDEQQKQIEELKALVQSLTKQAAYSTTNVSSSTAFLKQNAPNPFNKNTVISYSIPDNATNAQIIVTDMKGRLIKTFTATKDEGQINISSGELPAATYNYTLLVNGKKIDTKQMIITK